MLFVISPAKTLDYETPTTIRRPTMPQFLERSAELIDVLRTKSASDVAGLMELSESLATLNVDRYAAWSPKATVKNSKPAVHAFDGDVYDGLAARDLSERDLAWAQRHLLILSGLYGVLRPLDRLQPYRLEMGTALETAHGRNLYDYWGDTLTRHINQRLAHDASPVLVNLASQEYFRSLQPRDGEPLAARVIDCVFEDWKGGDYKIISFFAKKARGMMVRHAITQRVSTPGGLKKFASGGYAFSREASTKDRYVFRRRADAESGDE